MQIKKDSSVNILNTNISLYYINLTFYKKRTFGLFAKINKIYICKLLCFKQMKYILTAPLKITTVTPSLNPYS